jgi:hypothetical protein
MEGHLTELAWNDHCGQMSTCAWFPRGKSYLVCEELEPVSPMSIVMDSVLFVREICGLAGFPSRGRTVLSWFPLICALAVEAILLYKERCLLNSASYL